MVERACDEGGQSGFVYATRRFYAQAPQLLSGANFDLAAFDHVALWDPAQEWIEMRLRSDEPQIVTLPAIGLTVPFAEGEEMRTEVSAKFRPDGVAAELSAAGFTMLHWWTDTGGQFGLSLSAPV